MDLHLILYSRPECHLCEEMKAVIEPLMDEFEASLREIDIDTDPALVAEFGHEIPVLFINGRKAFKCRVTSRDLRAKLERVNRGRDG